jgi:hypothetical protein
MIGILQCLNYSVLSIHERKLYNIWWDNKFYIFQSTLHFYYYIRKRKLISRFIRFGVFYITLIIQMQMTQQFKYCWFLSLYMEKKSDFKIYQIWSSLYYSYYTNANDATIQILLIFYYHYNYCQCHSHYHCCLLSVFCCSVAQSKHTASTVLSSINDLHFMNRSRTV